MRTTIRKAILAGLTIWTLYWLIAGWGYLQEHSIVVQQGFGGDGIQMWEIFNIKMVAAHHAIRWGVGAALGFGLLRFAARPRQRGVSGAVAHAAATASDAAA